MLTRSSFQNALAPHMPRLAPRIGRPELGMHTRIAPRTIGAEGWKSPSLLGHAPTGPSLSGEMRGTGGLGPGAMVLKPVSPQQREAIQAKRRTGIEGPQTLKSAMVHALTVGAGHE